MAWIIEAADDEWEQAGARQKRKTARIADKRAQRHAAEKEAVRKAAEEEAVRKAAQAANEEAKRSRKEAIQQSVKKSLDEVARQARDQLELRRWRCLNRGRVGGTLEEYRVEAARVEALRSQADAAMVAKAKEHMQSIAWASPLTLETDPRFAICANASNACRTTEVAR